MPVKLVWVFAPLGLYALAVAALALRRRSLTRMALNLHLSLLLLAYLLATAGLGIFWVANQQLPVFDWHYLFGYATLILVGLHLFFNLPVVARWFTRGQPKQTGGAAVAASKVTLAVVALVAAYFVGTRQGSADMPAPARGSVAADPVAAYHEFSSESRSSVFRRAAGVAWGDRPAPFKAYPGVPVIALGKGAARAQQLGDMLAAPARTGGKLDLAELGRILYLSAGVTQRRGGNALRAAPSSGALFPSELYVVARDVGGLAPGLYHYDPDGHRLQWIGPVPAATGAPQADAAEALVVLTAIFRRTGYKYHNRAYRYALADAGHLLENLRLAVHGAGLPGQLIAQFDDVLAATALNIDGSEEAVLAMMPLASQPLVKSTFATAFVASPPAARTTSIGATGQVHQSTSLRMAPPEAQGARIDLPAAAPASADLYSVIERRRSARRFSDAALSLAVLASQLRDVAQPPHVSDAVSMTVVVNRVEGLAPGVYRYLPGHALRLVSRGDVADRARSAALSQDVIGDAAAVLILSAPRERVLAPGPRGYRHALIEAGMMGERWLLGAVARGLSACPVGAFYDDEGAALIGVDSRHHWVLHFAALGVPAG